MSLGRDSSSLGHSAAFKQDGSSGVLEDTKQNNLSLAGAEDVIDEDEDGMLLETNTVVENECDSEFQYLYHAGGGATANRDFSSPSVTSDRQGLIKSFETTSIHSP